MNGFSVENVPFVPVKCVLPLAF